MTERVAQLLQFPFPEIDAPMVLTMVRWAMALVAVAALIWIAGVLRRSRDEKTQSDNRNDLLAAFAALSLTSLVLEQAVAAQNGEATTRAPRFEVDPFWPKPLPNHWLLGATIGVWVDERDHIWIIHRSSATLNNNERGAELNPPTGECCRGAPPVLEFDPAGNLVGSWGGPGAGYEWPQSNHGIFVDHKGNVWIGGNGAGDSHILKFTRTGKFIAQYGKAGVHKGPVDAEGLSTYAGDSNDKQNFGRVAKIFVDPRDNEAYIADGYLNKRVAVLDADNGTMKRIGAPMGTGPTTRIRVA